MLSDIVRHMSDKKRKRDNMSENKRVTFRLNEEEIEKFKAFTDEYNISQADGFAKLIEAMEISKAKAMVSDRAKEIESMESHLNAIQNIYLTALEINQNAETTIKENYSKELTSKDQIIIDLQDKIKSLKEVAEQSKEVEKTNKELNKSIDDVTKQLEDKIEEIKKVNESNSTLNGIVAEYKGYKATNTELEKTNTKLKEEILDGATANKDLSNKLVAVQNELDNIKDFYQQQLKEVKADHKQTLADNSQTYENSIKEIKLEHKSEVQEIKKENKENTAELKLEHKQELEVLRSDKDNIIETLRNEIELLKKSNIKKAPAKKEIK